MAWRLPQRKSHSQSVAALRLLLIATAMTIADRAGAAHFAANDTCQLYGFVPHSRAYATCRRNARQYWNTGPCADGQFAFAHRRDCHLIPTFDF